jgi:hypothetical protein
VISDIVKAKLLLSVANGMSLTEAARVHGVKSTQAQHGIRTICRSGGRGHWISSDVSDIRADPTKYVDFASHIISNSKYALRRALQEKLTRILKPSLPDELTPKYLSNFTAQMLIESGFSSGVISEIQEWLVSNGTTLKRQSLSDDESFKLAKQAAFLLSAFGFKVDQIIASLSDADNQ